MVILDRTSPLRVTRSHIGRMSSDLKRGALAEPKKKMGFVIILTNFFLKYMQLFMRFKGISPYMITIN